MTSMVRRRDLKYFDVCVWVNGEDPGHTAPEEQSGQDLQ